MTPEQLLQSHLLQLPGDTDPDDVEALVVTRYPDADLDAEGGIRIGRHITLLGPQLLDDDTAARVHAPPDWPMSYAVRCPVEREDPPLPGTSHPDGVHRAFASGMPVRAEARAVDLVLALARRLDGVVRIAGSNVVLRPDPASRVDLTVHSPYWTQPEDLLPVVQQCEPSARLAIEGDDWAGPPQGVVESPPDRASADLREELRVALHAAADRVDAAAMNAPDELDAYAVVVDLGPNGRFGLLEVLVHPEESVVPALAGYEWADHVVTYEVRWSCPDEREAYLERPSPQHVAARDVAATAIGLIASALVDATEGVLVDSDGFLVDRYDI